MKTLKHFTIRLFANARYDFIKVRRWAYGVTAAVIVPGLVMLAATGITYSIEFTGGAMLHVRTTEPVETTRLRTALERGGVDNPEIQSFGSAQEYVIRARLDATDATESQAARVKAAASRALDADLGVGKYQIVQSEGVGPKVGAELQEKALIAILFSFVTTLIYLAFRFEWRFGLAAVVATAHDVLATIAFIRYLNLEVSLVVVAAILTVLGYSLNDTIVIFDRVRENLRLHGRRRLSELLNLSINETLPRTILTGGTTLATALVLSFFAGEVIKPFALVMTFGIIVGTFSSIFVASPVLLWIAQRGDCGSPERSRAACLSRCGGEGRPHRQYSRPPMRPHASLLRPPTELEWHMASGRVEPQAADTLTTSRMKRGSGRPRRPLSVAEVAVHLPNPVKTMAPPPPR
jgi:preprotein translocase SecF subunit